MKDGVSTQHSRSFSESTSVNREFSQIWSAKNLVVGNSAGYRFLIYMIYDYIFYNQDMYSIYLIIDIIWFI